MTVGTTGYATYTASVQTANTNAATNGFTGSGTPPSALFSGTNITGVQFPSERAINAAVAAGQMTNAQGAAALFQTRMAHQVAEDTARSTLRALNSGVGGGAGDVNDMPVLRIALCRVLKLDCRRRRRRRILRLVQG